MYIYIPTSAPVTVPIYIPLTSGDTEPYTGPMWIPILTIGIVFILLIAFWVILVKDILDWSADRVNVSLLVITTLVIIFLVVMLFL